MFPENSEFGKILLPNLTDVKRTKVYGKKDEKLARDAGISFSINQIVGLPMDEFNDLLSRHDLTEEQLNLCRDIRYCTLYTGCPILYEIVRVVRDRTIQCDLEHPVL